MLRVIASELFGKNHRVVKTIREQISNNERTTNRRWGSQISVKLDTNQAINKLFEFLLYWSLGVNIQRSPVLRLVIPNRNLVRGYLNVRWGWSLKISLLQNIYSFFWPQFLFCGQLARMFKFAYLYPKASYVTAPEKIPPRSIFRSDKLKILKKFEYSRKKRWFTGFF